MNLMRSEHGIDFGNRLELFVDEHLIDTMTDGAGLRLHKPIPREVALVTDKPWEGNMCGYVTVFRDEDAYRMYYKAWRMALEEGHMQEHHMHIAYAESEDGIRWQRPDLGLFDFDGCKKNNIVWQGEGDDLKGIHGFAPFKDANPVCPPEARYKAVGAARKSGDGLYAMASPDGIHWSMLREDSIITKGAFDSQNLVFWDPVRGEYRAYVRDFRDGCRGILTATSDDFVHWTDPVWLEYPGAPEEQLYTNQITPYHRAPHLFIGFPSRYTEREWSDSMNALPELEHRRLRSSVAPRYGTALTDGLFMSSRDGRTFKRWGEAFIRPGLRPQDNWTYGDNYQNWGVVETASELPGAPPELSFYVTEGYWRGQSTTFRRYTLRLDGFVSVQAPMSGGEFVTKPLLFKGARLVLNFSTSAAGSVRVEMQDAGGRPIQRFSLSDCVEIVGDEIERAVSWKQGRDVGRLSGQPIRLRFVLNDADLYAMHFE
jgi:hypothetical protein